MEEGLVDLISDELGEAADEGVQREEQALLLSPLGKGVKGERISPKGEPTAEVGGHPLRRAGHAEHAGKDGEAGRRLGMGKDEIRPTFLYWPYLKRIYSAYTSCVMVNHHSVRGSL